MKRVIATLAALLAASAFAAAKLEIIDGDSQTAVRGEYFAKPITVRFTLDGVPLVNHDVRIYFGQGAYVLFDGGSDRTYQTDSDGIVRSPRFRSASGVGPGKITVVAQEPNTRADMRISATHVTTDAAGNPYVPVAPLWWGGAGNPGWGVSVPQHGIRLFPVVFTYSQGKPVWYVLSGEWSYGMGASGYLGPIYSYVGAPYFAFDGKKVAARTAFGGALFPADDTIKKMRLQGTDPLESPSPSLMLADIEPFSFAPASPRAERGVSDIWWGGPSQSGWGISIAEDRGNLFLVWFTYDMDGNPTWFSMSEGTWTDADTWKGPIYRTSGTSILYSDPMARPFVATKVGDFSVKFSGTTAATFDYSLEGHSGTLALQRFDY